MMMFNARKSLLVIATVCCAINFNVCFGQNFPVDNSNGDSCRTPNNEDGNCQLIGKCEYVFNIIKTKGISHPDALKFVDSHDCGFEGRDQKVCCPKDEADDRIGFVDKNHERPKWPSTGNGYNQDRPFQNPTRLLPNKCGEDYSNRIIGGELTEPDEFPWMAVLEYTTNRGTIRACGGVLISKRYVITAAHCVSSIPSTWRLRNVRLGEYDMRTNPDCVDDGNGQSDCADPVLMVPVERQIVHENYMRPERFRNDIALLRLSRDVPTTRYVKPICLPTSGDVSSVFVSAGWGQIETRASSDVKLKVRLPYADFNTCRRTYWTKKVVLGAGQMCAGGAAGKDTCKGDSGGPLMKQVRGQTNRWVVDGIVSLGHSPCGLEGWPAVYTKVHNYVPWILSKLRP